MRKPRQPNHSTKIVLLAGAAGLMTLVPRVHADNAVDNLLNKLEQKGVLTTDEADELKAENEAGQTNNVNQAEPSIWKISNTFKGINFFGDLRLRYEYRGVDNIPGASPNTFYRERFRYALRFGIRGDLVDNFYYGIRLETSTNPRSPWDTFGNNTTAGSVTPSDKAQSGIGIGQAFIGWHPTGWLDIAAGRMAMPLYTTPMVWDSDINPEGAFEKFKYTVGDAELFVDLGQFDYQDPDSASAFPSSDTFVLAWQAGALVRLNDSTSFKIAPVVYTYAGDGSSGGLNQPFVGQGDAAGLNVGVPGGAGVTPPGTATDYNEEGLDHLLVLDVPAEFDFEIPTTPLV
jgi:hypothetical protein